jgi:hypothetical protein
MRYIQTIAYLTLLSSNALAASEVITCGDATSVGAEARMALHKAAQERAQREIEEFVGKSLEYRYINTLGMSGNAETMANVIEVLWCDSPNDPLHDAYYSLYSRHRHLFEGEELPVGFQ